MAKQTPHKKQPLTRCACEREDLKALKRLALDYELGDNPSAFHIAVTALREKLLGLLK